MSTIADLVIGVRTDTSQAEKGISSFGSKVKSGFGKALVPAVAALGVLGVVGKEAFTNIEDGAKNAKQTEQVIKTTGGAANVTAKHVDSLAMSLRRKAGVDDDVVHEGENMLLTFTNVRNEVGKGNNIFDQATRTTLNMSKALGQDTKSSAIQLGKALNDPVKGITALQRVGVSFTQDQKDQIKTLVQGKSALTALTDLGITPNKKATTALTAATKAGKSPTEALAAAHVKLTDKQMATFKEATAGGKTLQAQKIILHELGKEFGGAATNIDPMQRNLANLKLDAIDFASSLLQSLMPALQVMVGFLQKATGFMQDHEHATKVVVAVIAALAVGVIAVNVAMKVYAAGALLVKAATAGWTAAQWLLNAALSANPIGLVIIALAALAAGIYLAYTKSATFRKIVGEAFTFVKSAAEAVLGFFRGNWKTIAVLLSGPFAPLVLLATDAFGIRSKLVGAAEAIIGFFRGNWKTIAMLISGPFAPLVALATNAFGIRDKLIAAFETLFVKLPVAIAKTLTAIGQKLIAWAGSAFAYGFKIGTQIVEGVVGGLASLPGKVAGRLKDGLTGSVSTVGGWLHGSGDFMWTKHVIGKPMAQGVIEGWILGTASLPSTLKASVSNAVEAARSAIEAKRGALSSSWDALANDALTAFDGIHAKLLTKSEKTLSDLQAAHDKAQLTADVTDARTGLSTAMETGDQDQIKAAQQRLDDALYAQKVASLQKEAAAERLQLDARTALQRRHLEQQLADLEANLAKRGTSQAKAQQSVIRLLNAYGVDYHTAGQDLGTAFAKGMHESLGSVVKAVSAIMQAVAKYLPHSPADKGPLSTLPGWQDYLTRGLPGAVNTANAHLNNLARPTLGTTPQPGAAQGGGKALHVENLTVNDPIDLELLASRVAARLAL